MATTDEKNKSNKSVKGWGVDIDPENDPTYPMKKWTGDDHLRLYYARPGLQVATTEILHSNERPGLTAVFGISQPPRGLSGMIRRFAFRYSEGSWGHWLPLLLADRVDMVEGVIDDLKRGYVPNLFKETGLAVEWKYNRANLLKKAAIKVAIASAIVIWIGVRSRSRRSAKI